jgi:thiosulfate/3-mercaptopyruvate sulfurtransferase
VGRDELLVSPEWLSENLDDPSLRVLEATVLLKVDPESGTPTAESGREGWAAGHIPGSAFADLIELSDPDRPGPYKLPPAEAFAEGIGALGVSDDTRVVVYDSGATMWATRLWWMLRFFGHEATSVLDGGWSAWQAAGLPVSQDPSSYPPARFNPRLRRALLATLRQVEDYQAHGGACLVNALSPQMHSGETAIGYRRPGRIPGSHNVPYYGLLDGESGRFRPPEQIEAQFEKAGVLDVDRPVVTYCGGGAAATVDAFALALTGRDAAVYDGSLIEWTADSARPVETGSAQHPGAT